MNFCPNCGATLTPSSNFCSGCGMPVKGDVKTSEIDATNVTNTKAIDSLENKKIYFYNLKSFILIIFLQFAIFNCLMATLELGGELTPYVIGYLIGQTFILCLGALIFSNLGFSRKSSLFLIPLFLILLYVSNDAFNTVSEIAQHRNGKTVLSFIVVNIGAIFYSFVNILLMYKIIRQKN